MASTKRSGAAWLTSRQTRWRSLCRTAGAGSGSIALAAADCSLTGCSLIGCSLIGCSLTGCCLTGCSLMGCSRTGCSLAGTGSARHTGTVPMALALMSIISLVCLAD
ncbi:MAG: pentapeptide repeat-containing protein [Hyphomicrobiaceae bacterium]